MSYLLLITVVLAWGFSWYGITLQMQSDVSAVVSVAYRFILAASVLVIYQLARGRLRPVSLRDHPWLAAMGFCIFSMNFLCFYIGAIYIPSGLLSVIFATAAILGAFNQWIFFGRRASGRVILAAVMGVVGLLLLLGPEIDLSAQQNAPWWAFVLPFIGTYLFSLGNLISARLSPRYGVNNTVAQGMCYGALNCVLISLLLGYEFKFPANPMYWAGVVYLALIASVLAFLTYLTLVNREGPARAAYATVLFPIVAMVVSTWAEGYIWTLTSAIGLVLALGGTVLVFSRS